MDRRLEAPDDAAKRWTGGRQRGYDADMPADLTVVERAVRASASVRVALVAGFAIVFALWMMWGYQMVRGLQEIDRTVSSVHESYRRGEQTLSRVRTNVLLGSIYLRDALIDSASPGREVHRSELIRLRTDIERLLRDYVPEVTSPLEREHWAHLQVELGDYWAAREIGLAGSVALSPGEAALLLRRRIVPTRETVLEILDQLSALQDATNQRHRAEADAMYSQIRTRVVSMGAGTLIVALLVAVAASHHVQRLQRHIEKQRLNEQRNREDLERLSASLVDVQEQERRSLARELHDEIGQALTAVKMDIGIALRADVEPRVRAALDEAKDIAETALKGVRDLSQFLHPSVLDDFGLPATLTAYLRNFSQRTGIRAQLAETMDERLIPQLEVCVYRIAQEGLNNVAQHSGATACTVSLSTGRDLLRLVIEDNGRGLGATSAATSGRRGLGMIGMRERAQAFGGTFAIETREGAGTKLVVSLPLHRVREAAADPPQLRAG